jgi:hypothetical protein
MGISSSSLEFVSRRTLIGPLAQWVSLRQRQSVWHRSVLREDHLCRIGDHVFAVLVIHKRDGPKLPYQAVVIRQSAMLMRGRNAVGREGGDGSSRVVQDRSLRSFVVAIPRRASTAGNSSPIALAPRR